MVPSEDSMHITITKDKIATISLLMIYYVFLVLSYINWLSPRYSYIGFIISTDTFYIIMGVIAALGLSCITYSLIQRGKCTDIMILLLILLYFYPQIVLYSYNMNDTLFLLFVFCYLGGLLLFNHVIHLSPKKARVESHIDVFLLIVVAFGLFMIALSGVVTKFRISFDLSDYYEYRYSVREMAMPDVIRYPFSWVKQILPIGLVYAIIKKKWGLASFVAFSVILCFSFDGKKSVLFIFVLALIVGFFYKREYVCHFPIYMIFLNIGVFLEMIFRQGESFLGKHVLRRLMFIPAHLGWSFYNFFSTHELDYLRSSVLRRFGFKSPYSDSLARVIAAANNAYNDRGISNANTGLCGDAFANFGWLSVIIYPFIIILTFKLLEKYMSDLDDKLQIIICVIVSYAMLSGSFFTVLSTNGVLLIIFLLMLVPRTKETPLAERTLI